MEQHVSTYFAAWNERDAPERRRLLASSLTPDAELLDPRGRWVGLDAISDRIALYHGDAPDTRVVRSGGLDAHNDVVRYGWTIVDDDGHELLEGVDVAERERDGRLRRVLMFHGPLPE